MQIVLDKDLVDFMADEEMQQNTSWVTQEVHRAVIKYIRQGYSLTDTNKDELNRIEDNLGL